jgi:hypothetical protein
MITQTTLHTVSLYKQNQSVTVLTNDTDTVNLQGKA